MIGRILICGSRDWNDFDSIKTVVCACVSKYGDEISIIHGAARGADWSAGVAALDEELTVWVEPAKWSKHDKKAGPIRNQLMLDRYKPNLVIAFHHNIAASKGTGHMVQISRRAGLPIIIIANKEDAENVHDVLPQSLHA